MGSSVALGPEGRGTFFFFLEGALLPEPRSWGYRWGLEAGWHWITEEGRRQMEGDGSMDRAEMLLEVPWEQRTGEGLHLFLLSNPSISCQYLPLAESPRSQGTTETGELRSLWYRKGQENGRDWAENKLPLNSRVCLFYLFIHFNVFKFFLTFDHTMQHVGS